MEECITSFQTEEEKGQNLVKLREGVAWRIPLKGKSENRRQKERKHRQGERAGGKFFELRDESFSSGGVKRSQHLGEKGTHSALLISPLQEDHFLSHSSGTNLALICRNFCS